MGSLSTILIHPDEIYPLLKLKLAITKAQKQIPLDPHLTFCYSTLNKVFKTFSLIIQQLGTELRDAVLVSLPLSHSNMCVFRVFMLYFHHFLIQFVWVGVCVLLDSPSSWYCWLVLHKNNIDPSLYELFKKKKKIHLYFFNGIKFFMIGN